MHDRLDDSIDDRVQRGDTQGVRGTSYLGDAAGSSALGHEPVQFGRDIARSFQASGGAGFDIVQHLIGRGGTDSS